MNVTTGIDACLNAYAEQHPDYEFVSMCVVDAMTVMVAFRHKAGETSQKSGKVE